MAAPKEGEAGSTVYHKNQAEIARGTAESARTIGARVPSMRHSEYKRAGEASDRALQHEQAARRSFQGQAAAQFKHPGTITRHPDHAHDGQKHAEAQHAMMHGAKGGTFYINEHGHKIYGKK